MAIASELLSAYEATDFVVFDHGEEWVLKIGVASPRIDALLDRHGATRATVVTAFNPRSKVLAPDENAARHESLVRLLEERGLPFLCGEGLAVARRFDQNAVVFIARGKTPRLAFPET